MGEPFDELMSLLDSPVFLVTTQADGQPSGCLVSFATQVAVQPPRFMVAIAKTNQAAIVAGRSGHLAVHLLSQGRHTLAELFDGQDETSKFARCSWRAGPQGMPILDDAAAWFVGRILDRADFGDHLGYLLEPAGVWAPENPDELLYLSDLDDDDSGGTGHEEPQPFHDREPADTPRRYGVPRFTLDRF